MVDQNAANAVLYALSTLAQTCAALAALVGALALYRLQSMNEAHAANERRIRELIAAHFPFGREPALDEVLRVARAQIAPERKELQATVVESLRAAMIAWDRFDSRSVRAVKSFVIFEVSNLLTIFASLLGFACVSWLALHWWVFVWLLVAFSSTAVVVTACALFAMVRRIATSPTTGS